MVSFSTLAARDEAKTASIWSGKAEVRRWGREEWEKSSGGWNSRNSGWWWREEDMAVN
jgi:hypothetical protein